VKLFASQRGSFEGQLKHKHKRKADYARHCDASDHALAAIIIKTLDEEDERRPLYRFYASSRATAARTSHYGGGAK